MAAGTRAGETSGTPGLLSIGELAERTGVATSALRYYDELGLVRPAARASGRRRYAASAVAEVGVVLFLRDIGFSLAEVASLVGGGPRRSWREMIDRKVAELTEQQQRLEVALVALEHARRCPAGEPVRCPRFWSIVEDQLGGASLEESHARAHGQVPGKRAGASPSGASSRAAAAVPMTS